MSHSSFTYGRLKLFASAIRFGASFRDQLAKTQDDKFQIDSRSGKRKININVYKPSSPRRPSPVLLNWHGSGFIIPSHGTDELFCQRVARETDYTVLDASYALAPEYPFPAALEDVEDLILYVLERPEEYDLKNVVLSGFSAGGNLALVASSNRKSSIPKDAIRSVMAFYPPVDLATPPEQRRTPDGDLDPIPPWIMNTFDSCYMPPGVDNTDPRISVCRADTNDFPQNLLMVTVSKDCLAPAAESLAKSIEATGRKVTLKRSEGVAHAFDKTPAASKEGTVENTKRDGFYSLAITFLLTVYEGQ